MDNSMDKQKTNKHAQLSKKVRVPAEAFTGGLVFTVTFSQGVLVKEILCHSRFWCPHLAQVGHMVTQFFDGFDLLIQVVGLNEVT